MRIILILWAIPLILFWGWYGLSAYDMNFGLFFLEREFHDLIFGIYSRILGIPAEEIPAWLAWIFFVDTLIILAVSALRWYKHWLPQTVGWIKKRTGLAEEQREYVQRIYEPLSLNQSEEIIPAGSGPTPPAK
ncbi:MAG: DUF6105 family protein [Pseudomonadota bacterium]